VFTSVRCCVAVAVPLRGVVGNGLYESFRGGFQFFQPTASKFLESKQQLAKFRRPFPLEVMR